MYQIIFLIVVLFVFFNPNSAPCSEPQRLEGIIVTATRLETPVDEIANSVSIVTAKEMEEKKEPAVLDVLRGLPGIDVVQNGGPGGNASIFIRGAKSEHTLVMIDGVEVNDVTQAGHLYDFSNLTVDNIERIEVVRGPQSTLYGSSAIGGVINIITKKGTGKPKIFFAGEGGSYNSFRQSAGVSGSQGTLYYSLGFSHLSSQGFSSANRKYGNIEKDGYDNTSFSSRFGFAVGKYIDTDFVVRYIKAKTDIDNGGGPGFDDINNHGVSTQLLMKGKVNISLLEGRWIQAIELARNATDRAYNNPKDFQHPTDSEQSSYNGRLDKLGWQHTIELHKTNTLVLGAEHKEETAWSDYYYDSAWGPGNSIVPRENARNTGYYVQDQIRLGERFFGTAGMRLDDHSQIGSKTTYRFAPAYLIKEAALKIKGTYGTGVNAPSLYQLYAPATLWGPIGNKDLKPEESEGWDFGIEKGFLKDKVVLEITYFKNDFKNLIEYDNTLGYININKAKSEGVECSAKIKLTDDLRLNLSYTYTDTEDNGTGESLVRRPQNKFGIDTNYRFLTHGNINLRILYTGKRRDYTPYPAKGFMGGYMMVNAAAQYDLTSHIQVFGRIENLLNKQYQEVWGYGTPGFSLYGGMKVSF